MCGYHYSPSSALWVTFSFWNVPHLLCLVFVFFWFSPLGPLQGLFPMMHHPSAYSQLSLRFLSSDASSSGSRGHVPQLCAFAGLHACISHLPVGAQSLFSSALYPQSQHNAEQVLKYLFPLYTLKYEWVSDLPKSDETCTALVRAKGKEESRK